MEIKTCLASRDKDNKGISRPNKVIPWRKLRWAMCEMSPFPIEKENM